MAVSFFRSRTPKMADFGFPFGFSLKQTGGTNSEKARPLSLIAIVLDL